MKTGLNQLELSQYGLIEMNIQEMTVTNGGSFTGGFYPVLRFMADIYFALVNAIFELYNAFQPL